MNPRKAVCLLAALLIACVPLALAQGTYTQIDVPGSVQTFALGVDTAGDVVGSYVDARTGGYHGFLLSGGVYTTIDAPGQAGRTYATGINDQGQIVGYSQAGTSFLYDIPSKTFTIVALAIPTYARAINNAGTIVGSVIQGGALVGFEYVGGVFNKVLPRGFSASSLGGVNNAGEALGTGTRSPGKIINFFFSQGKFQLDEIPALLPFTTGINDQNAVVGSYYSPNAIYEGFVYQNSTFQSLIFSGAAATYAEAINNSGEVVGQFRDLNGLYHGFLWTPPADAAKK